MRRVLVARQDSNGDVLLAGPAVRAVAASGAPVTMLCGPRGEQAARLLPGVASVLVHEAEWIDPEPAPVSRAVVMELLDLLAAQRIDEAIILTSFHQSPLPLALLLRLAGVPFVAATSVDYPGSLLDVRHRISDEVHEVERSLSLVAACGHRLAAGDDGALRVRLDGPAIVPQLPEADYVVVHPGASAPARAWAPERYKALVGALRADGLHVVVTGSPGERALTRRVAGCGDDGVSDFGGLTDLAGLAHVLRGAAASVVGNTGPAHLAAAVGTPVVSLFAPTVPAVRWRPWMVPSEVLWADVPCAGCRARECPVPGHPCLAGVEVAEVRRAIERLTRMPLAVSIA